MAEATIGIFTPDQEKYLAQVIDNLLNLKGITGVLIGYALKIIIPLIDNRLVDKLSITIKNEIIAIVDALMGNQIQKAQKLTIDLVNQLNKYKPRDTSEVLFKSAAGLVAGSFMNEIETKQQIKINLIFK
jgi:hypothetical protein